MIMTKLFSLNFGFDVLIFDLDKHRELEIEIKLLNVDEKKFLKGSTESLDQSPLNLVSEWEGPGDHNTFMDFMDVDITKMGDQIEYSFKDGGEGEENFFLSMFLLPRYDRLLIKNEGNVIEEYTFSFEDYLDENNIQRRKWEIERVNLLKSIS